MTILESLNWAIDYLRKHLIENPRLQAELLIAASMHMRREELFIHFHDQVKQEERERLERLIRRRAHGEPLQYILGHQEFWSIDLKVTPRVLIPRPETEHLVEEALSILTKISFQQTPSVLELGTGSGAIAIALATELPSLFLIATDLSGDALRVARENAQAAGVSDRVRFVQGDWMEPFLPAEVFDLILSNPPYLSEADIQGLSKEVREYEPILALKGGEDGLEYYRRLIPQVPSYLKWGGWFLVEVGGTQASHVSQMIEASGQFQKVECAKDLSGIDRVVKAQRR